MLRAGASNTRGRCRRAQARCRTSVTGGRLAAPNPHAHHRGQPRWTRSALMPHDDRERGALVLGASPGMGEATSLALAQAGYRLAGTHLDFRAATAHGEDV